MHPSPSPAPVALPASPASPAFVSRPFPPPALENVPLPYILDQLHNLAVHYWDRPETADCTIVVPIVQPRPAARNSTGCIVPEAADVPMSAPAMLGSGFAAQPQPQRRATEPATSASRPTRMTSKLHLDYLLSQSSLFRSLFSGRPPPGPLDRASPSSPNTPPLLPRSLPPPHRLPSLLPGSSPTHPIIHLPLPDPASFPHLVHYMYFGTPAALEGALDRGAVRWEGVVRNAEYLGMRTPLKAFLGRWYKRHVGARASAGVCRPPIVFEEEEEEWDVDGMEEDARSRSSGSSYSGSGSSSYDSNSDYDDDEDSRSDDEDDDMSDTDDTLESVLGRGDSGGGIIDGADTAETAEDAKARIVKKVTSWMDDAEPERGRTLARKASMAPEVSPLRRAPRPMRL